MKANIVMPAIWMACLTASCHHAGTSSATSANMDTAKTVVIPDNVVQLTPAQIKNAGILTGEPEQKEMHSVIKVSGVLDVPPQNVVSISIPLGGYLRKMELIPGQRVNKGTVLATLEDQQYIQLQQDYLTAKNRLQFLEADYNRQKGLNETKATSDKVFQQVQSEYNNQKVLIRALAEKLRLIGISPDGLTDSNISRSINLYAPISGFVTKVNVNAGKYASPTDVLFELVNPDKLHLTLTVFENDASRLAVGQKIECFSNSHPDKKYAATIHLITPNIGNDRTTEVHCHLASYGNELLPGSYMNATIEQNNAKVTAVPEDAVVKWENKFYVFQQDGAGTFQLLPVETGTNNSGYVEIKSALPAGKIVIKNAYTILMKMKNGGEEN
ncbi:membrane fusion protein, cobalt-zinc-cadmium efflux system [Chitinophaga costaii]|uniref:Membrane fusion protein, cobalt-zinc-cadmium efflux system n=1 Tax=Chitinophaga costaii TaxID=1335309 RepID=A0A1C3Z1V1_9BACT|nr:efflux RND transporter periplasmic adaptor subunit [Chitinophaga costaii]PUZ30197.1 efflux RND transporter periplasmic adaptor subunit [Chitinophaga costaii]SCB76321.1 membrane fusion protein, cobalt-zinc-cadmium efflux system [Chitinophaga costaii]